MPLYSYVCEGCGLTYEEWHGLNEPHPICPKCHEPYGPIFHQNYQASQVVVFSKGEPTTVGQMAELNSKRLGAEQSRVRGEQAQKRVHKFVGWLPKGATLLEVPGEVPGEVAWYKSGGHPSD